MAHDQLSLIRYAAQSVTRTPGSRSTPEDIMSMVETSRTVGLSNDALTRRERVVLAELAEDVTLEEIATRLFVTRNTVKSQVRSVYRKIGVSTRSEAVAWAVAHGIR
jgi:LuxR family transcriptional regulator of spore coat protein